MSAYRLLNFRRGDAVLLAGDSGGAVPADARVCAGRLPLVRQHRRLHHLLRHYAQLNRWINQFYFYLKENYVKDILMGLKLVKGNVKLF